MDWNGRDTASKSPCNVAVHRHGDVDRDLRQHMAADRQRSMHGRRTERSSLSCRLSRAESHAPSFCAGCGAPLPRAAYAASAAAAMCSRSARSGEVGVATEILRTKAEQVSDDWACAAGLRLWSRRRHCCWSSRPAVRGHATLTVCRRPSSCRGCGAMSMDSLPLLAGCRSRLMLRHGVSIVP